MRGVQIQRSFAACSPSAPFVASDAQKEPYRASPFVAQNCDLVPTSVVQALLNARYYEGNRGQSISEDPVFWGRQNFANPQSLNVYSYANDNPINRSDPNGLASDIDSENVIQKASPRSGARRIRNQVKHPNTPLFPRANFWVSDWNFR
jgi:RHS repeat-associated protein